MATLVLAAAGSAIGASIGGTILGIGAATIGAAIGFQAGSIVDGRIFGGGHQTVEGPRLDDLAVQSSTYGAPVPIVFGTARMAGNIIWSTGLVETRHEDSQKVSGGKGGGSQTVTSVTYTYSVSCAVALCGRPVSDVGRIWADGKLLRDASGSLAVGGIIRVYKGSEEQSPDPLIEAHEGVGNVPAFRGLAYVVFDSLQLAEYANRIPNLTVEVIADQGGSVILADIVTELGVRAGLVDVDATDLDQSVAGYVISRPMTARAAMVPLASGFDFDTAEVDNIVLFTKYPKLPVATILDSDLAARTLGETHTDKVVTVRTQELDLPREVTVEYIDPDRDFQVGTQRARRLTTPSRHVELVSLPMVMSADNAKQTAEVALSRHWLFRDKHQFSVPISRAVLAPGDVIELPVGGEGRYVTLESIELGAGLLRCSARGYSGLAYQNIASADSGQYVSQTIESPGDTVLYILNLPSVTSTDATLPVFYMAAAGTEAAWRGTSVYISNDDGASYNLLTTISSQAIEGQVTNILAAGPAAYWDETNSLNVTLLRSDMELESVAELSVLNGANAALVGSEIIQFRDAVLEADGSYTLKGLLRGRRGTEISVASHGAAEPFILLKPENIKQINSAYQDIGRVFKYKALSSGQTIDDVTARDFSYQGVNFKPFAPVHVRGVRSGSGDLTLTWIRRGRIDGSWRDGVDVPLGESAEAYEIDIMNGSSVARTLSTTGQAASYSVAAQIADFGSAQSSLEVRIYQISEIVGRGTPVNATV